MSGIQGGTTKRWSPYFYDRVKLGVETELYLVCKHKRCLCPSTDSELRHLPSYFGKMDQSGPVFGRNVITDWY